MIRAIDEIETSSENVANTFKVFDDIAFQTNILALNPAVVAACAGEAGMRFAVVAHQIQHSSVFSSPSLLSFRARGSAMSTANRELVHHWFEEVWNKQSEDAIDEMFAPGGKSYGFPEASSILIGPDKFKEIHRFFIGAFPDIHVTVLDTICEGDRVAVTWVAGMTHLGDSLGFAPTLQKVSLEGCSVLVVRDGQIHEGKNYMEMEALINRLKASAAPPLETVAQTVA